MKSWSFQDCEIFQILKANIKEEMKTVKVLNIDIQNITRQELLENLKEGVLVTPNLDHLIKLQKDKEFYDVYQKSEWVVCDSKILYLFGKLLKTPIKEAIPGSSFFTSLYVPQG